jgi:cell division septation protein DedD
MYRERRSILPLISILAFIIIGAIVVYIYVIKGDNISGGDQIIVQNIKPTSNVNVIERDYEIAVTYPYAKNESRILISGYNRNLLSAKDVISEVQKEVNHEIKQQPKTEKISDVVNKPKIDEKEVIPVLEEPKVPTETKEEKSNRIFLYKNYYVVQVGTFKSEETANREADRYFNMGYNAFIEVVESRNGGKMYKLNVGDFTSEEFARQFQEKYIK